MKKLTLLAASAAMVLVAAAPAMAQVSDDDTDNSINDSFNTSVSIQAQSQSSVVAVSQVNSASSGDATAVDGAVAGSEASVFAPVSVYQNALQAGGDIFLFFY